MQGMTHAERSNALGMHPSYLPSGDPGMTGGGTYNGTDSEPIIQDYENIFGPTGRDIKEDLLRHKRHGRWHLPDYLKGPNPWMTDRIDGLITDATNSPFTTTILPYMYKQDPDGEIQWNVWSFDEGLASRVPYKSAARTLTQSKTTFSAYMVRHGLAIVMEHNFLASPDGRVNFQNQLNQLVGSIQYSNDLDVHVALVLAPSYQRKARERYFNNSKSPAQVCREYVDLFGAMQKNQNALDLLIEEAKAILRSWGGTMPDFMLANSKMTFQMTMIPEKTNYLTQGPDGQRRLKAGPDLPSYRGLKIIHSRAFSMEVGREPKDILRRRVRTAEYHRILPDPDNINREFDFFNEERDQWFTLAFKDLLRMARYVPIEGADEHHRDVEDVYHSLSAAPVANTHSLSAPVANTHSLSAPMLGVLLPHEQRFANYLALEFNAAGFRPLQAMFNYRQLAGRDPWIFSPCPFDMGITHIEPSNNELWDEWINLYNTNNNKDAAGVAFRDKFRSSVMPNSRLTNEMAAQLYEDMKGRAINDPYDPKMVHAPGSKGWFSAYTFYVSTYRRGGIPVDYLEIVPGAPAINWNSRLAVTTAFRDGRIRFKAALPDRDKVDIANQVIGPFGTLGAVNQGGCIYPDNANHFLAGQNLVAIQNMNDWFDLNSHGMMLGFKMLMTFELFEVLFARVRYNMHSGFFFEVVQYIDPQNYDIGDNADFVAAINACRGAIQAVALTDRMTKLIVRIYMACKYVGLIVEEPNQTRATIAAEMARRGIDTIPMTLLTTTRATFRSQGAEEIRRRTNESFGHLCLRALPVIPDDVNTAYLPGPVAPYNLPVMGTPEQVNAAKWATIRDIVAMLRRRIIADIRTMNLYAISVTEEHAVPAAGPGAAKGFVNQNVLGMDQNLITTVSANRWINPGAGMPRTIDQRTPDEVTSFVAGNLSGVAIRESEWTSPLPPPDVPPEKPRPSRVGDVEIVVVRPNIEHTMLGVILGHGGNDLGQTFWGQTELSVYDDAMFGIWGMSYKYHERAIVFNEKNLVRLWDISYDGYNGGKDDTYVDWTTRGGPNGWETFNRATLEMSQDYRGPSMMVFAFVHDKRRVDSSGQNVFDKNFRRNWPSPIKFSDTVGQAAAVPADYDNVHMISVEGFRVFNNELYTPVYRKYKEMMPDFHELHIQRKSAGQASVDSETPLDSLAFQGSMRTKKNGVIINEVVGSGHHGADFPGVASVRAGKGLRATGGITQTITIK